jgi:hypothetical protein
MERLSSARPLTPASGDAGFWGNERGSIVLGWITKLLVGFALAGVVLFDAMSVGTTYSSVADQGSFAARQASDTWSSTRDLQKAYVMASTTATESNPLNVIDPKTFRVDPNGTVHLKITRTATTLVLYRIGPLKHFGVVEQDAHGLSVPY